MPGYNRVLLKLSGEALASPDSCQDDAYGISQEMLQKLSTDIASALTFCPQICLVVGGGNIYRGVHGTKKYDMSRSDADSMGMLATVINGIALKNALEHANVPVRLMSSIPMHTVCEPYTSHRADDHLKKSRVVIFTGGTGNPFFTTDTAAALRAAEMKCDLMLKATKVKGVFCSDPKKNSEAVFLPQLTFSQVQERRLKVMDATAIALAQQNGTPIAVFSIYEPDGLRKVLQGEMECTFIN